MSAARLDFSGPGGGPVGAVEAFGHRIPGPGDLSALAEHPRAVGIFELYHVVVVDFAVLFADAHLAAAASVSFYGIGLLDPVGNIQVVHVLLDDMIAAQPVEIIPVVHLVFHFGLALFPRVYPQGAHIPIHPGGYDIAYGALLQFFDPLAVNGLVVALQPDHHVEFLLFGLFRSSQHLSDAGGVHRYRFFHEDLFPLGDRFAEVCRPETGRGCEDDDIGVRHRFFIGIKPYISALFGNVHAVFYRSFHAERIAQVLCAQAFVGVVQAMLEGIGHRDQSDILLCHERLQCGAGTAAAAAYEGYFDAVVHGTVGCLCER